MFFNFEGLNIGIMHAMDYSWHKIKILDKIIPASTRKTKVSLNLKK